MSDKEILSGLKKGDAKTFNYIYTSLFAQVKKFILGNSGNEKDAEDIFQEALLDVYRSTKKNKNFQLNKGFNNYFIGIIKFKWYDVLKKMKKEREYISENTTTEALASASANQEDPYAIYIEIFEWAFQFLSENCKKIIQWTFDRKTNKEIAQMMNKKESSVRSEKSGRCLKSLMKNSKLHPAYKNI